MHDIIYNLKGEKFKQGDILLSPGDIITRLYLLQDGVIEVYIQGENHEFVLEKLFRGSIINHRTFFTENSTDVNYRFARSSICFAITHEKLMEILQRHKELEKSFKLYKQKMIVQNKHFPIDVIVSVPKKRNVRKGFTQEEMNRIQPLRNTFKNAVIRKISEVRAIKAKPSLKEMITAYVTKMNEKDIRARARIKEKVLNIYEQENFTKFEENDPNFNKIIVHIERILKITTAQILAIDSLERKITNLSKRDPVVATNLMVSYLPYF